MEERRKVNKIEFLNLIRGKKAIEWVELIEDFEVTNALGADITAVPKSITFNNCIFKKIHHQRSIADWRFVDCSFETFTLSPENQHSYVGLTNCKGDELSGIGPNVILQLVVDGDRTKIGRINIITPCVQQLIVSEGKFDIVNVTNRDGGSVRFKSIDSEKCYLNGGGSTVEINNSTIAECRFDFVTMSTLISIEYCRNSKFYFRKSSIVVLRFIHCETTTVAFSECSCNDVSIIEGDFNELSFEGMGEYGLTTPTRKSGQVPPNVEALFPYPERDSNVLLFLIIERLIFRNVILKNDSSIIFNGAELANVEIQNLNNKGSIIVRNSDIKKKMSIISSDMGKTKFNNVTIASQCLVNLIDTDISEVVFDNFRWNNDYRINETYGKGVYNSEENFLISLRESYRQLKSLFSKNGNKIESLEFQKHEMRIHLELLSRHKFETLRSYGNYLIVGTNKWFSDFGQNIWKPVIFLLLFHLFLFNLLLLFVPEIGLEIGLNGKATIKGISLYFQTLLPIHFATVKSANNVDVQIGGVIDFFMRVCSGYFIYYFISASRKYHQST